jgi:hypothetical protein
MRASVKGEERGEWDTASWEVHFIFWMMVLLFGRSGSGGGRAEMEWLGEIAEGGEYRCDEPIFVR